LERGGAAARHRHAAAVAGAGLRSTVDRAALWEIGEEDGRIDVSVRRRCELRGPGIRFRGRPSLASDHVLLRDDIPVTSPAQTLVDLATELDPIALERAVNNADKRDLIDPEALREDLPRFAGEPGIRPLRHLLDKLFFRLSDSDLEIYFRRVVRTARLPIPLTKQRVNRFEVDFFWPDLGLIVETDGLRYHRTPSAQLRDARRDRAHVMAGMTPLRFTHYEVRYESARVRAELVKTVTMLRRRVRI